MKKKSPTVDAQQVKRTLVEVSKRIGRRKRIRAGEFFELMIEVMNQESYDKTQSPQAHPKN